MQSIHKPALASPTAAGSSSDSKACEACLAPFSFTKRKQQCGYCGSNFCSACLSQQAVLPADSGVSPPNPVRVCDMCHVMITTPTPCAFSFVTRPNTRPLNLAADSEQDAQEWVVALQKAIRVAKLAQQQSECESKQHSESIEQEVHKEGWLRKEDPTSRQWRRRYFVLHQDRMWFFELSLKGNIVLSEGFGVHAVQNDPTLPAETQAGDFSGMKSQSGFAYRFVLSNSNRMYALAADSEAEMMKWISAIQSVTKHRSGRGSGDATNNSSAEGTVRSIYAANIQQLAPTGQVTFVFTDVQSSTNLWEAVPVSMNEGLEEHDRILRSLLKRFRGYEVKTEGDAFMVTFFSALDAILWCLAVQQALLEVNWPADLLRMDAACQVSHPSGRLLFSGIRIRMGIHTGFPNCRRNPVTGRMDYFGPVVNRSARVSDSAHGGQIVCTQEVCDILNGAQQNNVSELSNAEEREMIQDVQKEDLGCHPYKGISEEVRVFQLSSSLLAGRQFPPLRTKKAKPAKFEEEDED
eukprot:TRINITY_DN8938_c0_g4_i4.p1 TRINITY_DN8938_c0_g4~~TRINITY_DN8938_c0_g4_i4.p1  ORF type:complete len:522 (-),score=89.10 TRINITY_DN8938_c0_g4_i4:80-1645(-)